MHLQYVTNQPPYVADADFKNGGPRNCFLLTLLILCILVERRPTPATYFKNDLLVMFSSIVYALTCSMHLYIPLSIT